jgi:hypothetical protein
MKLRFEMIQPKAQDIIDGKIQSVIKFADKVSELQNFKTPLFYLQESPEKAGIITRKILGGLH